MRPMLEAGTGCIVNVVHIYSFERGAPMFVHSGAARAGVVNLTRSLAPYLQQRNVRINALAPGTTVSPAAARNYGYTPDEWRATAERTRFAEPQEMAAIMLFLCSPAASMLNGAVLTADAAATQVNWPAYALDDLIDDVAGRFD
jgi:NAD(P)-dependent dehydrogenase (short-subunit alcohol dehydrogenase family)